MMIRGPLLRYQRTFMFLLAIIVIELALIIFIGR